MLHRHNQSGFVLNTTLLFLLIFSILAVSAVEISLLQVKINHHMLCQDQTEQLAMLCLQQAEKVLTNQDYAQAPIIKMTSDAEYHDERWWQENAENVAQDKAFVIEKLMNIPCYRIQGATNLGVDFYRLTARADDKDNNDWTIVQSTFAKAADKSSTCDNLNKIHLIHGGRQSWREIQ